MRALPQPFIETGPLLVHSQQQILVLPGRVPAMTNRVSVADTLTVASAIRISVRERASCTSAVAEEYGVASRVGLPGVPLPAENAILCRR